MVQLAKPATIDGHAYAAASVVAYDLRPTTPTDRRISLVYRPKDGEFIVDPFSGIVIGATKISMVVTRRGASRIVVATRSGDQWVAAAGIPEPVGTAVAISDFDSTSEPWFSCAKASDLKTARSKDGTDVDYYLLRPKGLKSTGRVPILTTGCGAFGISLTPSYFGNNVGDRSLIPWLTRGGALVVPMIRGGGERGEAWHQAATRERRQNSYDDFAAVTESLVADGLTTPKHIGVFGSSNGGLLAAVMGTQRPDLYGAIVSDAPLTDLIRMHHMGMGAAWINEYGNPNSAATRAAILKYSPYQNVIKGRFYPPLMITVATSDNRVGPGHARKLAAELEVAGATVCYMEDLEGHGVSDPLSRPDLMADRMTFLIDTLL